MKSYVFRVELVEEDDGRWSAGVPTLPGCATWGYTRDEALRNLRDAVEAYLPIALLRNVPVRRIVRALERDGFQFTERQGNQRIYRRPDGRRVVIHYHRPTLPSHRM